MAASKLHLKNLDKNYKLKKTDKVTTEGKPIYVNTLTGEEHSELSITLEYPANSGKWVNVPSLLDGRVYNSKGVLAMLKAGRLTATSTHMNEQEASEAAAYRSTTLQSNTGETLKPNNELVVSTGIEAMNANIAASVSKLDNMSAAEKSALTIEILKDKAENPEKYESVMTDTSNVDNVDAVRDAFINQNMNSFANTFPTRDENPEGLFRLDDALDDQILNTDQASMKKVAADNIRLKELAAMTKEANMNSRHPEGKGYWANIFDRDRLDRKFKLSLNPNAQSTRDGTGYPEEKMRPSPSSSPAVGSGIPALKGYEKGENLFDGKNTKYAQFGTASKGSGINALQGMELAESRFKEGVGNMKYAGNKTANGSGMATKRGEDLAEQYSIDSNKGLFKYKPHMSPDEKINDNRSLKKLTPQYGKMPGFKFVSAGTEDPEAGYWSADENSQFWKTDAGYEKAQQTWGNSGTLPNYVKRPVKKELNINAIKKFFSSNN